MDEKPEVYSLPEFCKAHRISRATFYRLLAAGRAPLLMRVNRRVLVSSESAAQWCRKMERETRQVGDND